ncbi:MAG TPA: hypothetical protein ENJ64_06185 [Thiotrichales bacterium]|nr:hypothetical protein [Thiotrichales bacterium]
MLWPILWRGLWHFTGACLLLASFVQPAVAAPPVNLPAMAAGLNQSGFRLPGDATVPVIEYRRHIAMLANAPSQLQLQVYADGRVHVHFPVYMKKAGDYDYQLSATELVQLIRSLTDNGMMEFDPLAVQQQKRSYDNRMKARGEYFAVSDAVESVVTIRLPWYQKSLLSPVQTNLVKNFSWKNLEQDARRYRDNTSIQSAAAAMQALDSLLQHPAMRKVK